MLDTFSYGPDRTTVHAVYELAEYALIENHEKLSDQQREATICAILGHAYEDVEAYHSRDPGVRDRDILCLISPHSTFFAVLSYRLAHQLAVFEREMKAAFDLQYFARSKTGVEIHPEAHIGKRFIIDHGWGTVIGQTTEIGDDCYILNNVTLGGRSIANAPSGKRHPRVGHRVQISGRAKVFGPVSIGNDCFIGPDVEITQDIPNGMKVLTAEKEVSISTLSKKLLDPSYV